MADSLNLRTLIETTNSVLQNRLDIGEMHFVSTLPSLFERNANHTNNVIFLQFNQFAFLVSLYFNSSSKPYALLESNVAMSVFLSSMRPGG